MGLERDVNVWDVVDREQIPTVPFLALESYL
jgi:hypothetical protein